MLNFLDALRQTMRRLGRAPLFTVVTLITLAVAIGANSVVFSVVEAVLLKPLNYPAADRLIGVWYSAKGIGIDNLNISPSFYFITREQNATLEDIGAYDGDAFSITGAGQPEHVRGLDVTDGTLPLLGVKPILGRLFTHSDDTPSAAQTVLVSYAYWQQKFGGSPSVIGRTIIADGLSRQIIGVLPRNFHFLDWPDAALYAPMQWDRGKTKLGNFSFQSIARLRPGVSQAQASADIARLIPIALRSFPPPDGFSVKVFETANLQPNLRPLKQDVIGDIGKVLWVLMGSIVVVLLVACANVANLLLVRVEGRRQELAIRTALGAGRGRLTSDLLIESLVLSFGGCAIGLGFAYGALRLLAAHAPTSLPRIREISINLPVLLFTLGITLFVTLVIGLIPAIKYAGLTAFTGLREGGRSLSQSRERHRARKTLVVVQVSLALVLIICSGLMIRTFYALTRVNPGFASPDTLQSFNIFIPETQIPDAQRDRVTQMEQQIANRIAAIPGVSSVAFSTSIPMDGRSSSDPLFAQDRVYKEGDLPPVRRFKFVSPGFFSTIGTPLVAGRDLTWTDTYQKLPVAIVSENLAREFWHDPADALGKHIRVGSTDDWREVIGVAADIRDDGVNKPASSSVYWPLMMDHFEGNIQHLQRSVRYAVRSPRAGSAEFMREVEQAVWQIDPDLPLADPSTVGAYYTKSMARTSFTLIMLSVAGAMALLLGIVGIYGVVSYAVSQRTREIGIRMALGAQRNTLSAMFVRQGLMLTAMGVAFGIAASFAVMRLMSSLLFNVSPADPETYILASAAVVVIASLACYLPSRRAATVDPVHALRSE